MKYSATFPLLLNLSGEPTYFIALKDDAGLVKKYAMVNVQKYQIVAIGDTVSECEESYTNLMYKNGIKTEAKDIFDVSVVDFIDIIRYNVGDEVTVEYKEGEKANTVLSLTGDPK